MIAAQTVTAKKLKIKFSSQISESAPGIKACVSARHAAENYHHWSDETRNMKQKPTGSGSNKRGPPLIMEAEPQKRQKMDRSVTQQCSSLVKSLINNPCGWVFKDPVDPVALNIPDYFSIISKPMDLGTVKSKLEKTMYSGTNEFAADVRLTFSNAILYNPPSNYVHKMAQKLNKIFETRWKSLQAKWNHEISNPSSGKVLTGKPEEVSDIRKNCPGTAPLHNAVLAKREKSSKATNNLSHARKEVKLSKPGESCVRKVIERDSNKGTNSGGRRACGSANVKQSLSPVVSGCGTCGSITCQCSLRSDSTHASSDISSERSSGRDNHACSTEPSVSGCQGKHMSTSQISKSDPDSDGAVSALDDENICPSSQLTTSATDATSAEGWRQPILDVQLSPTKALRAAMLKHRFAATILKAQHKTLLDQGDKANPLKLQQEKERLEKRQQEDKALIEAKIRAAADASRKREEAELKRQREKEREAARVALQKMEKTAEIVQNLDVLKELEMLSGGTLFYKFHVDSRRAGNVAGDPRSPLEKLGLFIKDDAGEEDEILNRDEEEGEIFP
ncbi:hypothetical protein JCGZ_21648 [Jatropha curcas]|uniref:Bromo domain-containing protein n=1 Tax=Jatropha curcas TaxID=180498 RepID=A0A067JBM6_JATCU|nr:transcription factor GTE12 [Jatropha curcas]XP_012091872.1 transcription factor GTE12 [Jatropha curcas]XP_012091873.1 transcription factor GTE12 [Jatropha curcas]KDP21177.1 hypothetical protein JCGZ_21648 [Jatropha curcas]